MTSTDLINHLYYKKLPQIYRDMDTSLMTKPFYRYLSALIDGGYAEALSDVDNLLDLIDPQKCPGEFLPMLCSSFGLTYFEDINPIYQRKFLQNIGEITRRRGTYSCVKFIAKVLTGLDVELGYERNSTGRHLTVMLLAKTLEDISNIDTSINVIARYIQTQIPYYITTHINSRVASQNIENKLYTANAITSYAHYKLG